MTINKGPANNTEACLQHEITRLTGENFDLREKIENLNDTVKRIKRQLKSYMKKLNEVGGMIILKYLTNVCSAPFFNLHNISRISNIVFT